MPSPFPGMDPYLEGRGIWPDVHHSLITAMRDALAPQVAPGYFVAVEERTYIVEVDQQAFIAYPDAAIIAASPEPQRTHGGGTATAVARVPLTVRLPLYEKMREGYLEIRDARTHEVITAIEVLSPTNKAPGEGRKEYEAKRRHVLQRLTNLVEIDLLRGGTPMEMTPTPECDYRIVVGSGWERPRASLYAISVRQPLPDLQVPLRERETEAVLSVGKLLADVYARARYDIRLDYSSTPPEPPLAPDDNVWVDALLQGKGLRKARPCP